VPPRRNSMAGRLDVPHTAGADAFTQPVADPPVRRRRAGGRPKIGDGWESRQKRVTFYCPLDVLEVLDTQVEQTGRSLTQVIVTALRHEYGIEEAES
jgi:hypothetical protein